LSQFGFIVILEVPARAIWQEKEINVILIGKKGRKLSLLADDMILDIGKPNKATLKTSYN
jgi:hypothetical protein